MASTNKTTNYELSQFLGSDKPAWLSDYNSDMNKIDAQMKLNADGVSSASGSASSANTAIGTLANLTTTDKTDLVRAINEVDGHADTASETASSALTTATSASTSVGNLQSYLTLSSVTTYSTTSQFSVTGGGGTVNSASITVARNADGTLGKVYGYIVLNGTNTSGNSTVKLNVDTGLRPTEEIVISGCGYSQADVNNVGTIATGLSMTINVDGTIVFQGYHPAGTVVYHRPLGCLLFIQNFGDQPE
ncbi:MAG: hypothetical protein J6S67_11620 [Methanobrevibacter sp.]|nr:hypothetical protein [Methanobrevibacter sp.]